ncbi:MAG: TauD/TfdA dioxygenase family protein [Thermomicrobiales bacterium]
MSNIGVQLNDRPLGHKITGLDLSRDISDTEFDELSQLYERYGVIVVSGQTLSSEQQIRFSQRFSELVRFPMEQFNLADYPDILVVSNVIENGKPIGVGDAGRCWHTDMWYTDAPPRGSLLYALEVPVENGRALGDTMFASTSHAYDTLPADTKKFLEGRMATFSHDYHAEWRASQAVSEKSAARKTRSETSIPDNRHPLVKIHPKTGRKCLYVSEGAIIAIDGMERADAMRLVDELLQHVTRDDVVYRHNWGVGDLLMWDNYSCLHCAIGDFPASLRRRMHRTTIR